MRKARQWRLTTLWPKDADDYMKAGMAGGTSKSNWLRQMLGYWGIVAMMVKNGILREKQFLEPAISGEVFFVLAKIRAFLPELRERTKNPDMLRNV